MRGIDGFQTANFNLGFSKLSLVKNLRPTVGQPRTPSSYANQSVVRPWYRNKTIQSTQTVKYETKAIYVFVYVVFQMMDQIKT